MGTIGDHHEDGLPCHLYTDGPMSMSVSLGISSKFYTHCLQDSPCWMTHRHLNLNIFQRKLRLSSINMTYFFLFSKCGTTTNPGILARSLEGTPHFLLFFIISWYNQSLFPTCFPSFQHLSTNKVELLIVFHLDS